MLKDLKELLEKVEEFKKYHSTSGAYPEDEIDYITINLNDAITHVTDFDQEQYNADMVYGEIERGSR